MNYCVPDVPFFELVVWYAKHMAAIVALLPLLAVLYGVVVLIVERRKGS